MGDYIERELVIKVLERYGTTNGSSLGHHSGAVDCAIESIERIPAANVEPIKQGEWIILPYTELFTWRCSRCNGGFDLMANYCPYCGAKMEE